MKTLKDSEREMLFSFFEQVYPLTKDDFEKIVTYIRKKAYKKGEFVLEMDQIETKTNFILKGVIHQFVIIDDETFTIDISLPGMSFNNFTSFVEETPSKQLQEAIADSEILYIEKTDSEKLLIESPAFCYIYAKLYEQVHLEREKRSLLLQYKNAEKRFELFLNTIQKSSRFLNEVSQKLIASYLSLTPETYSRVKKSFYKK
jgi:CRP/FNR family transcriptional regulator, anaerobic regulatory protein